MNPNLSPLSNSGVELAYGQEVFYFINGDKRKKGLLFVVGDQFKEGEVLEIDALIEEKKKVCTIATYNIRYDGHSDLANDWPERKIPIAQFVINNQIEVIGFQEVLNNQLQDLRTLLPRYNYIGVGRDDGREMGEFAPIFYDSTRFVVLESGTFWLSPTPLIPSKGWDAALNRICTYALLQEKANDQTFWIFNTHFDHVGVEARFHSAELLLSQAATYAKGSDSPILLIGDLNMEPTDPVLDLITSTYKDLTCSFRHSELCSPPTFNGFTLTDHDDKRIDYIFGSSEIITVQNKVYTDRFGKSYPSDHFPVVVKYKILR